MCKPNRILREFEDLSGKIIGKYKVLSLYKSNYNENNRTYRDDLFSVECLDCGEITIKSRKSIENSILHSPCKHPTICPEFFIGKIAGKYIIEEYLGKERKSHLYKCKCTKCNLHTNILLKHLKEIMIKGYDLNSQCMHSIDYPNELIGRKYNKYTVVGIANNEIFKNKLMLKVKCELCGYIGEMKYDQLLRADTLPFYKHCNHGIWNDDKLKSIYYAMRDRCENPNNRKYNNYGEKGITVCDQWKNYYGMISFIKDAESKGYKSGCNLTIDRIDSNGNYCPENTQWVTKKYNSLFTSRNDIIRIKYPGFDSILSAKQWATKLTTDSTYYSHKFKTKDYDTKYDKLYDITIDILSRLSMKTQSEQNKELPGAMVELDVKPIGDFNEDGEFIYKVDNLQLIIDKEEKGDFDFDLSKLRKDNDDDNKD